MRRISAVMAARARETDDDGFATWVRDWIASQTDEETASEYFQAMPPETLWAGLHRYWSKREAR